MPRPVAALLLFPSRHCLVSLDAFDPQAFLLDIQQAPLPTISPGHGMSSFCARAPASAAAAPL